MTVTMPLLMKYPSVSLAASSTLSLLMICHTNNAAKKVSKGLCEVNQTIPLCMQGGVTILPARSPARPLQYGHSCPQWLAGSQTSLQCQSVCHRLPRQRLAAHQSEGKRDARPQSRYKSIKCQTSVYSETHFIVVCTHEKRILNDGTSANQGAQAHNRVVYLGVLQVKEHTRSCHVSRGQSTNRSARTKLQSACLLDISHHIS